MARPAMKPKKKPSWLTLLDFLSIALPGIAVLALDLYLQFVPVEGKPGWQWLMLAVGLCFIAGWALVVRSRKQRIDSYRWYPTYGIMALANGYELPDDATMDGLVRETINRWALPFGDKAAAAVYGDGDVFWVTFRKDLDENANNLARAKVEGFTVRATRVMEIDYDSPSDPIEKTSLSHEIGHVIYGFSTGDWDQQSEHDYIRKNGLR